MQKQSSFHLKSVVGVVSFSCFAGVALLSAASPATAQTQEVTGRVISSTPVLVQVPVQTQVCGNMPVAIQQPNSGGGALLGASAGGAIGNALGGGAGKALATAAGVVGGAMVGNSIEANGNAQVVNAPQCGVQTAYQNRTLFNVVYEYADKQYSVQMPVDPGQTIQLQLGPVQAPATPLPSNVTVVTPAYYPYPGYYPGYYPYAPIGVSVGVGYWGGRYWGGGRRWH